MENDEVVCRFGTPLEPLVEDEVPSKKPIQIEDQIVTDENGRRRFHGAFTGGFSAGFWNTVGSLEGWKPREFKSSRLEKAELQKQKPSDFMDDEDMGEFGIAPQRVQTTEDFTPAEKSDRPLKRKFQQKSEGIIPGVPVLEQLLRPARDGVAIRLLKKMGWKQGQGIGARQTGKEKTKSVQRNAREQYVMSMYGCDVVPKAGNNTDDCETNSDHSDLEEEISFAPDDFEPYACAIKDNSFGLGYTGLSRNPVLKSQHVNLFGPLEIIDKGNKKLSITGQAFGVGALEEEDEDIYQRDDMTKYDFTLKKSEKKSKSVKLAQIQDVHIIDGFHLKSVTGKSAKEIFTVTLPSDYKPRNWATRKTRFEPLDDNVAADLQMRDLYKHRGLGRHDLDSNDRRKILEESSTTTIKSDQVKLKNSSKECDKHKSYLEQINKKYKATELAKRDKVLEMITGKMDKFTNSEVIKEDGTINKKSDMLQKGVQEENTKITNEAAKITKNLDNKVGVFKPFLANEPKQKRYEKFIAANLKTDEDITKFMGKIQPIHMSEWDREMEKKEFLQAKKIYQPLQGIMNDRFVTESTIVAEREVSKITKDAGIENEFVRTNVLWKPCALLCKRFNIAEPYEGTMIEEKVEKKPKFSVFDYLEASINNKSNFVTPVIFPKKIETAKPMITERVSAKDVFEKELNTLSKSQSTKSTNSSGKAEKHAKNVSHMEINLSKRELKSPDRINKRTVASVAKPKTELEKKIEESKEKHPSEKKDLFKSIFDDSDEENEDTKDNSDNPSGSGMAPTVSTNIPNEILAMLTKPAAELNILRNNSPPRGIFAAYFNKTSEGETDGAIDSKKIANINRETIEENKSTMLPPKIVFQSKKNREATQKQEDSADNPESSYGPHVPTVPLKKVTLSETPIATIDEKLSTLLHKVKKHTKVEVEWVEKTNETENKTSDKSKKKKKKEKDTEKCKKLKKHKKHKKNKK